MELVFQQLGISVLLGMLVGLQREHAGGSLAGLRTFPLITVFGSLLAMLAERFQDGWILAGGVAAIVAVMVVGHLFRPRPDPQPGTTTDVAMLLMFVVGAMTVLGPMSVAVVVGGGVAVLLQFKPELHGLAQRLGDEDLRAIMQFVLITCIILPVLPNRNFSPADLLRLGVSPTDSAPDPLKVLNPFETWLMVVLIVGLSLGGYIVYKFFGRGAGIILGGVLGGAISSTATTVSYSRNARSDPFGVQTAVIVILVASAVMYLRVLMAVSVVSPEFLRSLLPPAIVLFILTLTPALLLWLRFGKQSATMPEQSNPTQLRSALVFGLMYAGVLLALALAKEYWRSGGLYAVAFLSGLTEMDAVTLSTARMSLNDVGVMTDGWRLIVVAAMANSLSKAVIAGLLGGWTLFVRICLLFAIPMLGGGALLWMW